METSRVASSNYAITPAHCMQQFSHGTHITPWTKEENMKFERAIAYFDEKTPDRWLKVASMIPGKSVGDVMNQYMVLVADVSDIEAGLVPVPGYLASSSSSVDRMGDRSRCFDLYRKRSRNYDYLEQRKGVPWTEEEHRRFLLGLVKHGRGDWRNISRNYVISKTPTQVASHAQKYYQRQLSSGKDKRRPSIHDTTTFDLMAQKSSLDLCNNIKLQLLSDLVTKSNGEGDHRKNNISYYFTNSDGLESLQRWW